MKTSLYKLIIAWMAVILPLSWGVYKSAIKSKPLFVKEPAASTR